MSPPKSGRLEETHWPDGRRRGWRAWQYAVTTLYPDGHEFSKRFPLETPRDTMQAWQDAIRVDARRGVLDQQARTTGTGFLADAERYLELVRHNPSWAERCREIRRWGEVFGDRPSAAITAPDIRRVVADWRDHGKRVQQRQPDGSMAWVPGPDGLSPQSINLRLRALENLWTVLWPGQPNPVRAVDELELAPPHARAVSFEIGFEILAHMVDTTRPVKGGAVEEGSWSRARFEVMLLTSLEAKQVGVLTPEQIDWTMPAYLPPARHKGRGRGRVRGRQRVIVPRVLVPQAVPALKRLFALGANRPFSNASLGKAVRAGLRAANRARVAKGLPPLPETLTVKALTRHTFATEVFDVTKGDLRQVQHQLGHRGRGFEMSTRYALSAVTTQQRRTASKIGKRVAAAMPAPLPRLVKKSGGGKGVGKGVA